MQIYVELTPETAEIITRYRIEGENVTDNVNKAIAEYNKNKTSGITRVISPMKHIKIEREATNDYFQPEKMLV